MNKADLVSLMEQLRREYHLQGGTMRAPEVWVMCTYRFGRWSSELSGLSRKLSGKAYGALSLGMLVTTGCTIHREADLGSGFHLVHVGNVKIHPQVRLGKNVGVMHDVTIGVNMERPGVPVIGDNVFIGAGAKILGPVHIGDGARIAANSLVLSDVPAGATAVGVPARALRYTGRAAAAAASEPVERAGGLEPPAVVGLGSTNSGRPPAG